VVVVGEGLLESRKPGSITSTRMLSAGCSGAARWMDKLAECSGTTEITCCPALPAFPGGPYTLTLSRPSPTPELTDASVACQRGYSVGYLGEYGV
jgi:hypothetical protein